MIVGRSTQRVRLARLNRDAALLEGERGLSVAAVKRCEHEMELRRIVAPVGGVLGEVAELRAGGYVNAGQKLGAIIPSGQLKAVAQFSPLTAAGRLRPGQPARLRLDGYPWMQYGTVGARVVSVATEPRDGHLRVELALNPNAASLIPRQHGLSGTAEVTVDQVSPAALVLRAAGKLLAAPPALD